MYSGRGVFLKFPKNNILFVAGSISPGSFIIRGLAARMENVADMRQESIRMVNGAIMCGN